MTSCSRYGGTIAQLMNMPSTWPRSSASYTPGSGMPTGVAPSAFAVSPTKRPGTLSFNPLKSASVFTCFARVCRIEASVVCEAMIFEPLSSFVMSHFVAHSNTAGLWPAEMPTLVNGSSVPSSPG